MSANGTFIVLREPGEARRSGWVNTVKNWYDDEQEARNEAARLCTQSGKRFVVFRAFAYVEPSAPPVEWHDGPFDPVTPVPAPVAETSDRELDDDGLEGLPF